MEILGDDLPIDIISDFAHTPDGYKITRSNEKLEKENVHYC